MTSVIGFKPFDAALRMRFAGLIDQASAQDQLLLHSPGTLVYLDKAGREYVYWRYYVPGGKQRDEYVGPAADTETQARISEIQAAIAEAKSLMEASRLLRQAGFAAADNSTSLTLATLFNAGVFRGGAMLIGTHAFGAILNTLGIRPSVSYRSEDVDIARYGQIKIALGPEERFVDLLRKSGLNFTPIPPLDHHRPPSSFRVRGENLSVDLVVPGDKEYRAYPIPELHTHATGLPFLRYLLEENMVTVILGRDHVIPVRVP